MIINMQLPIKIGDTICFLKATDENKYATITEIHIIVFGSKENNVKIKLFWQQYEEENNKKILCDEGSTYLDYLGKDFCVV